MRQFIFSVKEYLLSKKYILLILGGMIGLLSFFIIYMVNGIDIESLEAIIASFPEGMFDFFGDIEIFSNPYGFWSLEMLSFIWLYAGIYIVYMASSLLSQEVEEKTIDLSLSKPITRYNFLASKITFLYIFIVGTMGIFFLITMGGMAFSSIFLEEGLYFDRLWLTYLNVVLFLGALAMFAKLFSTIFLATRKSMALAVVVLFLMFFLGEFYIYMDASVQWVKYISVFYYFNPAEYLVNSDIPLYIRDLIVLGSINTGLIIASLFIFNKKDIPI
ncbi:MAG: ABC transporter permease subunit [Candidatus Lokiarchaeota archaeon]|nr:ABC transporter permease subunit [Candidatus Lokiarchaeota archaeon]